MTFIQTIIDEMFKGNFSFLILIVGILQWIEMKKNRKRKQIYYIVEIPNDNCKYKKVTVFTNKKNADLFLKQMEDMEDEFDLNINEV